MRHVTVAAVIMLVLVFVAFLYVQSPSYPPSPGPFVAGGHPASAAAPAQQASFATGTGTNLTASAEDFSGGKWHPENLAVAAATAKAPDGSTGAYNLTETTVDGRHRSETIVAGLLRGHPTRCQYSYGPPDVTLWNSRCVTRRPANIASCGSI